MRLLKQAMAVLGTVVVIAVIAALVTPKTTHAIVSTLVTVANTPANPVLTLNVDEPTDQPFEKELCLDNSGSALCGPLPDSFPVPSTTASGATVKRLVIQYVSGFCSTTTGAAYSVSLETSGNSPLLNGDNFAVNSFVPVALGFQDGAYRFVLATATRISADPAATLSLRSNIDFPVICTMQVNGYLATQ